MAKYSFNNYELVTYRLDFTCGFELSVTCSYIDGRRRHLKGKTFCFKTARGLANAVAALIEMTPHAKSVGFWIDDSASSKERRKAYNRAYGEAHELMPV